MKKIILVSLLFTFFFNVSSAQQVGSEHIIKSNVLNLLFARPSLTYELKIAKRQSLSLTAYTGKIVFITLEQWRGAHVCYRHYINKSGNLTGLYSSIGLNFHQKRFSSINENHTGLRLDIGYQRYKGNKRFVWDVGAGLFASLIENGMTKLEPEMRLNLSLGYRIK